MHHLLVYECHGNFSNASLYGSGFDCSVPNMPLRSCYDYSVVAVWAVGGTVRRLTYSSPEESNFKFEIFWLLKGFSLLFLKMYVLLSNRHFIIHRRLGIQLIRTRQGRFFLSYTMTILMQLKVSTSHSASFVCFNFQLRRRNNERCILPSAIKYLFTSTFFFVK